MQQLVDSNKGSDGREELVSGWYFDEAEEK